MSIWLQSAVEHNDLNRIRQILDAVESQQDAEDKLTNSNGYSLLTTCVETNQDNSSLLTLLEYHHKYGITVDIKHKSTGITALHIAVQLQKPSFCKTLILGGAFVSSKDSRGRTPLHIAIDKQNLEIVSLLLDYGANVHAKNKKGQTPIEQLTSCKSELFKSQVEIKFKSTRTITVLKNRDKNQAKNIFYYISIGDIVNVRKLTNPSTIHSLSSRGHSPIYLACKNGFLGILQYLVSQGASLRVHNTLSTTPLHAAVENSHEHIVQYLIDNNVDLYLENHDHKLPLEVAMASQKYSIAEKLMKKMLEIVFNKNSSKWNWYLRQACKEGILPLVKLLVESKCVDVNAQTNNGWAPLHIAVRYGKLPIIEYLLQNNADPSLPNSEQWNPLHIASELEVSPIKSLIVECLLQYHVDVNATTKSGLIPLYIAVNKGDAQVVTIIVENGGNVNFVLREKKLVEIALSKGHHEIVGTLLYKGATVGPTVLWEAVRVGDTSLVKNLLQGDVDVNYVHKGWSIYDMAILKELDASIVSKMIEKGAISGNGKAGYTTLHTAVTNGNVSLVRTILSQEENRDLCNTPNDKGYYPLHTAIIIKNHEIVSELLKNGASPSQPFPLGKKLICSLPLYTAIKMGNLDVVESLLSYGTDTVTAFKDGSVMHTACNLLNKELVALVTRYCDEDVNKMNAQGYAPLHIVAMKARNPLSIEVLKELLSVPSVDVALACSKHSRTALHFAADNGNLEFVKILVKTPGINVNAIERRGWTPMMTAIDKGHREIAMYLWNNGADPTIQANDSWSAVHQVAVKGDLKFLQELHKSGVNLNINGKIGTPITVAIKHAKRDIITFLSQLGSDIQVASLANSHWSVLHDVAKKGDISMATTLIEANMPLDIKADTGFTPLHIAILYANYEIAKLLVLKGANIDIATNPTKWGVLHTAAKREGNGGYAEIMELMVSKSGDINLAEQGGLTPLDVAIDADNKTAVSILLAHKAISRRFFINVQGTRKWTALHWCASNGRHRVVSPISKVIDPNAIATASKNTALHLAAMRGNDKVIKALLASGADVNLVNRDGQTPLGLAVIRNKKKSARALLLAENIKIESDGINVVDIAPARGKKSMQNLILNSAYKNYQQKSVPQLPADNTRKVKSQWKNYIEEEMEADKAKNDLYEKDLFDDEDDDIIGY